MGTDALFIVTNLEGRAKTLYEKVFVCARGSAENLIKDMKRWTRSDKTACSRGRQTSSGSSCNGCLLAAACAATCGTEAIALARKATFETIRRHLREGRCRCRGVEGQDQAAFPASYPHASMLGAMTGAITTRGP